MTTMTHHRRQPALLPSLLGMRLLGWAALLLFAPGARAQAPRAEIGANRQFASSNYLAYPGPRRVLTAAPRGYEPFYLSHYGRHGSRYLIGAGDYDRPLAVLARADSAGALTARGREALGQVRRLRREADRRLGELSPLGAEQHRQIARRMAERFPQVFADTARVEARSTTVIRCILSMGSALQELAAMNPRLRIFHDASLHDMYYMNDDANPRWMKARDTRRARDSIRAFQLRHTPDSARLAALLFADARFAATVDQRQLGRDLFDLARAVQNVELRHQLSLWDLFTDDEAYQYWLQDNAWWYTYYGPCPYNGGSGMHTQDNLLRNIVATADSCLRLDRPGATLRYAHESDVMPLTCLLNLNGFGDPVQDLEQLPDSGWANYRIYPMACNVQFVFYRKAGSALPADVLVKVLLNEDEATLPVSTDCAPYYPWPALRAYLLGRLSRD